MKKLAWALSLFRSVEFLRHTRRVCRSRAQNGNTCLTSQTVAGPGGGTFCPASLKAISPGGLGQKLAKGILFGPIPYGDTHEYSPWAGAMDDPSTKRPAKGRLRILIFQSIARWFSLNSPFAARRSESVERQIVGSPFKRVAE